MSSTPLFFDRVLETSTTVGTGNYELAGAITGYQSFAVVGDGNSCYYCAADVDANGSPIGDWEVGIGTYTSSGTTLSRDVIQASSNAGAAVDWAAGTRHVFLVVSAGYATSTAAADAVADLSGANVPGTDSHFSRSDHQHGIDSHAISNAMFRQSSALSIVGRSSNSTGDVADIAAAADGQVLRRSGSSIGFGAVDLSNSSAVTNALALANLPSIASGSILGRSAAGSGDPAALTLSQVLDLIGSAAQGDLLYRGASGWARLPAGTAGDFLKTQGASADPIWAPAFVPDSTVGLYATAHFFMLGAGQANNGTIAVGWQGVVTWSGAASIAARTKNFQVLTSAAALGSVASFIPATTTGIDWSYPFDLTFDIFTGSNIGNIRLWIGLSSANPGNSDTAAQRFVGFRYSTVVPDAGWIGVNFDGTTQATTSSLANIAASTEYKLRIRSDGTQTWFSVNGGAETNLSSHFPSGTTRVAPLGFIINQNGSAHTLEVARVWGFYGA